MKIHFFIGRSAKTLKRKKRFKKWHDKSPYYISFTTLFLPVVFHAHLWYASFCVGNFNAFWNSHHRSRNGFEVMPQMLIGTVRMRIRSGAMISSPKEERKRNKIIYLLDVGLRKQNANKFYTLYLQRGVSPVGLSLSLSLTSSVRFLHCIVTSFKMQFSTLIPKLVHFDCVKGWNESPKWRSHQKNVIQMLCTLQKRFAFELALLI